MAFYTGGSILPLVPRIIETKGGDPVRAQRLERREGDSAMRCSKCGAENPDRARFCIECAFALTRKCRSCSRWPLSSAILHFLWQDLRGNSQARNARASMAQDIKSKALDLALSQIEKQFGKGSIMKLGEQAIEADLSVVSTGSLGLDLALGVGGLPRGRVVEIYGPESSGKTTLALDCIAEGQKRRGVGAFIDAEHALDASYARKLGVSVEDLLISQPDNGEQALEITETLVQSGAIDVLVIDSVAALAPRAENLS